MPLLASNTVGLLGLVLTLLAGASLPAALALLSCVAKKRVSGSDWLLSSTSVLLGVVSLWFGIAQLEGAGMFFLAFCLPLFTGVVGLLVCIRLR